MAGGATISAEYRALQQELHRNPRYGVASLGHAGTVGNIMRREKVVSISDYGAGKCSLLRGLVERSVAMPPYFP